MADPAERDVAIGLGRALRGGADARTRCALPQTLRVGRAAPSAGAAPGAFTPLCSAQHLPGYVTHADAIKKKGVDEVPTIVFYLAYNGFLLLFLTPFNSLFLIYVATVLTIWSMVYYLQKALPEIRAKVR